LRQASRRFIRFTRQIEGVLFIHYPKAKTSGGNITLEVTHIQTTKTQMKNPKYKALVMVDDMTNSVIVMFNGFEDYEDAWCFSQHITEELELDKIPVAKPMTVH